MAKSIIKKYKLITIFSILAILEVSLIFFILPFFSSPVIGYSNGSVVVRTTLNVGTVAPEVLLVALTNTSTSYTNINLSLNPATGKTVYCNGVVRDYNNDTDISSVAARIFQNTTSEWASDDNNTHYTNSTCFIDYNATNSGAWGDDNTGNYTANFSCSFNMQYYANPTFWTCSVYAYNSYNWNGTNSTVGGVNELLAVTLPSTINYGTVNSTAVSDENITNVSNAGNVQINLTLQGYAFYPGDGQSMNCSKGNVKNISIMYEKYNLTTSNPGVLALSDIEAIYTNLTNSSVTKRFNLNYRQADNWDDATNATYWRIYVPRGVAGTCSGNIVFGAIKSAGSA